MESIYRISANKMDRVSVGGDPVIHPQDVVKDLVNYTYVKKALEANPAWKMDASVPQSGDPFKRVEVIST